MNLPVGRPTTYMQYTSHYKLADDMRRAERDECKRLVADAKAQSESDTSGEYQYKVRGFPKKMRVVKLRIRN